MEGPILFFFDEMGLNDLESLFLYLRLFLFNEIFKHNIIIVMQIGKQQEFCELELNLFYQKAYDCKINVVGAVKEIFQHKKYIVQLCIGNEPVLRCLKRYSQFEALYQVIHMNFKNIDLGLGQFPSKFQVVHREETRRSYFQQMLNRIIQIFLQKMTNQTNRRLFSTLYVFLVGNQQKILKSELRVSPKTQRIRKLSEHSNNSHMSEDLNEIYESAYNEQQHSESMKKKQNRLIEQKAKASNLVYDASRLGEEATMRLFMACEFLIKFEDEHDWKQRYLKLQNSCLLIYKHKNDNNFKSRIELFQAKIQYLRRNKNAFDHFCQKMEIDNEPKFPQDTSIITISHEHDFKKFMIKNKERQIIQLSKIKQLLIKASRSQLVTDFQGVFNPIGKLFVIVHSLNFTKGNPKTTPIVYIRIKISGLVYQTKRMTFACNSVMSFKQTFIIPISNAFTNIFVQVIMIEDDGIIRHESQQKCVGSHQISFSDFFSYPEGQGLQRVSATIGKKGSQNNMYQGNMQLSVINYSHISSIYADSYANQNDGVILSGLKSTSDTQELVITVDRVLRVIGNIALFITAFWRNVYLFKYPRMSYTFFIVLILFFNFGSAFSYFRCFLYSFIVVMLYQLPFTRTIIVQLMDFYVFKHIHKDFLPPLCLCTNELKFLQWTTNLTAMKRNYRVNPTGKLQKTQQAKDKKFEQWNFVVHGKSYKVIEQSPTLLQKVFEVKKIVQLVLRMISAVVNTLQKIFNVLSWADRRRSIIIFGILFFVVNVANTYIFQAIGTIFCIHRIYKGIKFYENRHYHNNRKLAVYCLRYIINQKFNFLIPGPQKLIKTVDRGEIEVILDSLYFPLRDQKQLKILKEAVEHILGVYIDTEQLFKREVKLKDGKSAFALIYLVTIIQTCEARLKLQWISGQQGISDEFQELKNLTNEELVIDLWVQSLLINFFLNMPSQLYTTFRPVRSKESLKLHKEGSNQNLIFRRIKI